mmetsp:Transcript_12270/g.10875  ORF Transcript_12270/g.10875 Transcript_12270/m.10875 type:complete len:132 (-) Transcript_12270:186-581(-)
MKGTPECPKDDYQSTLISSLNKHKFTYNYYDITKDSNLREQLKEYTLCTSYPQIFLGNKFYSSMTEFIDLLESGKALSLIPTTEVVMKPREKLINLLQQKRVTVLIEGEEMTPETKDSMQITQFMHTSKIN